MPRRPGRELSPVSAYCEGELDPDEARAFAQLQVRNRELRWQLGLPGTSAVAPGVQAQVEEHLARLRFAVAENARLRQDIVQLQASLVANGLALPGATPREPKEAAALARLGGAFPVAPLATTLLEPDEGGPEHERQAADVLAEIQAVTKANIELISRYDEQVKELEGQVLQERRRLQSAEVRGQAGSMGCLTPPRSAASLAEEAVRRGELLQLEAECEKYAEELQRELALRHEAEGRAAQEIQMAQEIQREELEHFRRLVQGKKHGPAAPTVPNTGALLEAELEQVQEHLAQMQLRGDQERAAADCHAEELKREMRDLGQELQVLKGDREACLRELEELRRAGGDCHHGAANPPEGGGGGRSEMQRLNGESLAKEVVRTRRRVELLDSKILQLDQEAKDIRERANLVLRAVPDLPGGPDDAEDKEQVAKLQELVGQRQLQVQAAKRTEEALAEEQAAAQQALEAARVEASVMEQKMRLLRSRTGAGQQ